MIFAIAVYEGEVLGVGSFDALLDEFDQGHALIVDSYENAPRIWGGQIKRRAWNDAGLAISEVEVTK